jgi:hypothetical protein
MLPFIEDSALKNRNTLDKNKYTDKYKVSGFTFGDTQAYLASFSHCFNPNYSYTRLRTRVTSMNLVAVFALLISVSRG